MFARSSARWIEPSRFGWCLAVLLIMASSPVGATVLTGPIVDLPEATVTFYWGDGAHDLYQQGRLPTRPRDGSTAQPTLERRMPTSIPIPG